MRGSIRKRGESYYIIYRHSGKQMWKKAGESKKEAERQLTETISKINKGTYKELKAATFKEFGKAWLRRHKAHLKESSYLTYQMIVEKHLFPFFGEYELKDVDSELIQEWISQKLEEGLKPSAVHKYFVPLREMLFHAVKWGYLYRNPAEGVTKPKLEKKEIDYLTPEEIGKLLEAAQDRPRDYTLLLTLCLTGLRIGEALALSWDDIDFVSSTIFVRRSIYNGKITTPKSKSSRRRVSVPRILLDTLLSYQLSCPDSKDNLIFASQDGNPMDRNNVRKRVLDRALLKAGLRKVSIHSLRHSYATMLLEQGENIKFVQKQLGHSSISTTLDLYGHCLPATGFEAMKRLEQTAFQNNFVSKMLANRQNMEEEMATVSEKSLVRAGGR